MPRCCPRIDKQFPALSTQQASSQVDSWFVRGMKSITVFTSKKIVMMPICASSFSLPVFIYLNTGTS